MASEDSVAAQVIRKAWSDPDFKTRLLADGNRALADIGVEVPAGMQIRIVADEPGIQHYVLPMRPESAELTDEHLDAVVGGLMPRAAKK